MTSMPLTTAGTEAISQAEIDLAELAYAVSHDVRAPARHLASFSELALRNFDTDPERARMHLERVALASGQLQRMLEALLLYSRIGRLDAAHQTLRVGDLVAVALADHATALEAARVRVDVRRDLEFIAEPTQATYLFSAAIGNIAAHAGPDVHAIIDATEDAGTVTIDIIDDGCGIRTTDHEDAMRLFRQITHTAEEHVGAGLALIQRIAKNHGGAATLLPADGTHLRITLNKQRGHA